MKTITMLDLVAQPVMPALEIWRQKDQEFKVGLSYISSSRSAWVKRDPALKENSPKQSDNNINTIGQKK